MAQASKDLILFVMLKLARYMLIVGDNGKWQVFFSNGYPLPWRSLPLCARLAPDP